VLIGAIQILIDAGFDKDRIRDVLTVLGKRLRR
jgi:hypothetical protein